MNHPATSLTMRTATLDELERTDSTDNANLVDGAGAILLDGGLVGITNEYGTAVWVAPGVDRNTVELAAEHGFNLIAEGYEP